MLNVISVDVEEYFHATNISSVVGLPGKHNLPSRVEISTRRVLALFERTGVKATFFVLGHVARRYPHLVLEIANAGHEVASHGYAHRLAYQQTAPQFLRDIYRAKCVLEDVIGKEVCGYRAPNFSIKSENAWAYDMLLRAGYKYDSSCFPVWHPRYNNRDKTLMPHVVEREGGSLYVFPLAAASVHVFGKEIRLPLAGGAYWRLFPCQLFIFGLRQIAKNDPGWFVCYLHPWEFDAGQPNVHGLSFLTRLRHYGGIERLEYKTEKILKSFDFGPLCEAGKQVFGQGYLDNHA